MPVHRGAGASAARRAPVDAMNCTEPLHDAAGLARAAGRLVGFEAGIQLAKNCGLRVSAQNSSGTRTVALPWRFLWLVPLQQCRLWPQYLPLEACRWLQEARLRANSSGPATYRRFCWRSSAPNPPVFACIRLQLVDAASAGEGCHCWDSNETLSAAGAALPEVRFHHPTIPRQSWRCLQLGSRERGSRSAFPRHRCQPHVHRKSLRWAAPQAQMELACWQNTASPCLGEALMKADCWMNSVV
mmetsp:Transcript_75150/g.212554  ORF Transcript_75150/g.212554 Transcript_75150/m.212554 type:complete len:243 (-) Transcript_75150:7-735(-)